MEQIMLEIIDDPANVAVFKGAGHLAATRAESAIRMLESAFPQLHFEIVVNHGLSNLKATAIVRSPIDSDEFIDVLSQALVTTGTRVAPLRTTDSANRVKAY
jgi:hypothetical protein